VRLDRADLSTSLSALRLVRRTLRSRNENTAAFDHAIEALDAALTPTASADGRPKTAVGQTEWHDWCSVAEAARLLDCSERRARQIAPSIGGKKRAGTWWIPRSALPTED